jgi:spermidine synthase
MNHDALANPKVHVTIGDARELLLVGRAKYDLIVSEPSNPYRAGIASLFTREYYEAAAKKLNSGGIFAQWVQAYEIDDRTIQTVYATFGSVFPNIETWQTEEGDLLLVGTTGPRAYDADELRRRIAQEPFQTALRQAWHVSSLEGFLAHFIADHTIADRLQRLQPRPALNTDDRTVLEYAFARNVDRQNGFRLSAFRLMAGVMHANRLPISSGEISWPNVDADRLSMLLGFDEPPNPAEYASEALQSSAAAYVNYLKGDLPRALQYWKMHRREPLDLNELLMVAECTANQADPEADAYIEQLRKFMPNEADAILVSLLWHQGKREEAADLLEKVLQRLHSDPWLSLAVTARTLALAEQIGTQSSSGATVMRLYETLRKPFCVYDGDNARLADLLLLGVRLDKGHYGKYTLAAIEQVEPFVLWQPTFLRIRAACYKAVGSPRFAQAERDLNEFVAEQPVHLDVVPQRNVAPAGQPGAAMPAAPK